MRKLKLFLGSFIFTFLFLSINVVRANFSVTVPNPSKYNTLEDIVNTLGGLVRPIVVVALIAVLMYGGFVRLTSAGDPGKIALSSKIIVSALVGFALIVLAPVLVDFAGSLFGVRGGLTDFTEVTTGT